MKKFILLLFILLNTFTISVFAKTALKYSDKIENKTIIGRVEWVQLLSTKLNLLARIDTGAKICSIHAFDIKLIDVGDEKYVVYKTYDKDNKIVQNRSPFIRIARVRGASGGVNSRYIVKEVIRLGKIKKNVLLSLNDRSKLIYKFLVGRNLLRGKFLVDVAKSHTQEEPK